MKVVCMWCHQWCWFLMVVVVVEVGWVEGGGGGPISTGRADEQGDLEGRNKDAARKLACMPSSDLYDH